jgi:general secretion pathway protein C
VSSKYLKKKRPPLEKWYLPALIIFIGYCVADLAVLGIRDRMLPQSAPPAHPKSGNIVASAAPGAYGSIASRNIFSATGEIPEALFDQTKGAAAQREEIPVPSQLPLNLIGTLVHSNPEKSLAAIEVKGKNQVVSYTPGREIPGVAMIVKVERQKVIFRNLNINRLEYIEMKKDAKLAFGGAPIASKGEVKKIDENTFAIKRDDLLKYTKNLSSILMQARAVPNRDPSTGNINGFRILDMQPGSIYEQLGLQKMDVIRSVDGTAVDSPAKAMELYRALKDSPRVTLQIERNGKAETKTFNIQ